MTNFFRSSGGMPSGPIPTRPIKIQNPGIMGPPQVQPAPGASTGIPTGDKASCPV